MDLQKWKARARADMFKMQDSDKRDELKKTINELTLQYDQCKMDAPDLYDEVKEVQESLKRVHNQLRKRSDEGVGPGDNNDGGLGNGDPMSEKSETKDKGTTVVVSASWLDLVHI